MNRTLATPRLLHLLCGLLVLLVAPLAHAATAAPLKDGELRVRLGDYWTMRLASRDGAWEPVTRARPSFKQVDVGYVSASSGSPENFTVSVQLRRDGAGSNAGFVFYDLTLTRKADGSYDGTFVETSGGKKVEGTLTAALNPAPKDFGPAVGPNEYPRLLMRKSDLPELRKKFESPFGQAFLEKAKTSEDPIVNGLLYQLTGDEKHARSAMRAIKSMKDIDGNSTAGSGEIGHTIVNVALAVDLSCEAWPADYRESIFRELKSRLPQRQWDLLIEHANYNQASNYYGPAFGSAAIATLLLKNLPGPAPVEPAKPLAVRRADCRIPPAADYTPPQGVPLVPLVSDTLPGEWIYAGGFKPAENADLLSDLGGPAKARPTPGDKVSDGARTALFKPLSQEQDMGYYEWMGRKVIDVTNAIGRIYHSESYFYTVLKNDKPGWYEFGLGTDHKESFAYLNGELIREGDAVQLDAGTYPLLIKVRIGQTQPWGREMLAVRFTHMPDGKIRKTNAEEINAAIKAEHEQALAFWKTESAEWKARRGEDLECLRIITKSQEQMYQHLRFGIGNGGFQAEVATYGNTAARYPLLYATLHRRTMGRDLSTFPDATHVLPRLVMQASFADREPHIMALNVKPNFDMGWIATNFPVVPTEYQPAVLWAWNRGFGLEETATPKNYRAAAEKILGKLSGQLLAATFINYPVDLAAAPPAKAMPKTWAADTLGFYVFRNGFEPGNEFIAQVFTKNVPIRAWSHPNAGAFRIWGLGHAWTSAPIDRSGYRPEESVVLLPDDVTSESGCGLITHYATKPDGSGSLSVDLSDVYLAVAEQKKDEVATMIDADPTDPVDKSLKMAPPKSVTAYYREKDRDALRSKLPKLYNAYGDRLKDVKYKSHVDGDRAMAFDFSGKSGAPFLMVLVDRVSGGKTKQWLWQMPTGDPTLTATAAENTFNLKYPDASLRGTVVSPNAKARFMKNQEMYFIYRGGSSKGANTMRTFDFIAVETADKDATFFVVVTIQKGNPPAVTASGKGENTVVKVGEQTIRLRDGVIVIE